MLRLLKRFFTRLFWRHPPHPGSLGDPYAGVRVPRGGRPAGRSAAVAVMEPDDR